MLMSETLLSTEYQCFRKFSPTSFRMPYIIVIGEIFPSEKRFSKT